MIGAQRSRRPGPARAGQRRPLDRRLRFWVLSAFLALVFATGGSSFGNVPHLALLRPVAILMMAYGIVTLRPDHWRGDRLLFVLVGAAVGLTALHLVPLPPALWHGLPGRDLVRTIDATAGLEGLWRPLSLTPTRTINALLALTIPVATLLVGVQLAPSDRIRLLYVLLVLGEISAVVGMLQAAGLPISLFHVLSPGKAIEAAGLFANQNHQATLLAMLVPMLAVAVRIGPDRRPGATVMTLSATACVLAVLLLLIVTGSRAGLVLGVIALAFTAFYGLLQSDRLDRMSPRSAALIKLATVAAVVVMAVVVTVWTARGLALQRLELVGTDLRPRLWASILPILSDHQPWGSGIGSYVEVYRWGEPLALLRATYSNHAHNEYLEVALTAGVPGLLLLIAALALVARALWRHRRGSSRAAVMARLGGAMIVILACASITDYPLRTPVMSAVLMVAGLWCFGRSDGDATDERRHA